jgi:hypothetical protein
MGKHRQSVSDAVRRGHAELVLEASDAIGRLLDAIPSMKIDGFPRLNEK